MSVEGLGSEPAPASGPILAAASGGGHFSQLALLRGAFAGTDVTYCTTIPEMAEAFAMRPCVAIPDCNANTPLQALYCLLVSGWKVFRLRPRMVVSTGAMPGLIVLGWGRLFGARTLWIDSIANAERLSVSGKLARRLAHLTLSQWPHVARLEGVEFEGAVL